MSDYPFEPPDKLSISESVVLIIMVGVVAVYYGISRLFSRRRD